MQSCRRRARSYFLQSLSPLTLLSALKPISLPLAKVDRSSLKLASQVASWFSLTCFQQWPGIGQIGIGFIWPRFRITNSGTIRDLSLPACGCSPRPLKIPGGSTKKLATFSTLLFQMQVLYFASCSAFSWASRFFSSLLRLARSSFYFSRCSLILLKSKSARLVAPNSVEKRLKKLSVKFFLTSSFSANSLPSIWAHQLQTSSTSGSSASGLP